MTAFSFDKSDTVSVSMKPGTNMVVNLCVHLVIGKYCLMHPNCWFLYFFSEILKQSCWNWNLVHPALNLAFLKL